MIDELINELKFNTSDKPLMRSPIAITNVLDKIKVIQLLATPEIIESIVEYGLLEHRHGDSYSLCVDARYDFDEVVQYIANMETK